MPQPLAGQHNHYLTGGGNWSPAYSFIGIFRNGPGAANSPDVTLDFTYPGVTGFPFDTFMNDSAATNPYIVVNKTGSPQVTSTTFTLTAGRTYRLSAAFPQIKPAVNNTVLEYSWVAQNGGTTAFIAHPGQFGSPPNAGGKYDFTCVPCVCIYTPTVANTVVRFWNISSLAPTYAVATISCFTASGVGCTPWCRIEVIG